MERISEAAGKTGVGDREEADFEHGVAAKAVDENLVLKLAKAGDARVRQNRAIHRDVRAMSDHVRPFNGGGVICSTHNILRIF